MSNNILKFFKLHHPPTTGEIFQRFIDEICHHRKGGRQEMYRLMRFIDDDIGKIPIDKLSGVDLSCYIKRQAHLKTSSINRDLTLILSVLGYARKYWDMKVPEVSGSFKRPQNPPPRERRIHEHEISAILKIADPTHVISRDDLCITANCPKTLIIAMVFLFAIETAMRKQEILSLKFSDICFTGAYAQIRRSKTGRARRVPLSDRAMWCVRKMHSPHDGYIFPVSSGSMCVLFRRMRDRAGITGLTFHDTRHEAITRLSKHLGVLPLARMVGHSNINQLMTYYNPTTNEIANMINAGYDNTQISYGDYSYLGTSSCSPCSEHC